MHDHTYTGRVVLERITTITNKHYRGDPGDKAFLYRYCSHEGCESRETVDYGPYATMKELYDTLTSQAGETVPAAETEES